MAPRRMKAGLSMQRAAGQPELAREEGQRTRVIDIFINDKIVDRDYSSRARPHAEASRRAAPGAPGPAPRFGARVGGADSLKM